MKKFSFKATILAATLAIAASSASAAQWLFTGTTSDDDQIQLGLVTDGSMKVTDLFGFVNFTAALGVAECPNVAALFSCDQMLMGGSMPFSSSGLLFEFGGELGNIYDKAGTLYFAQTGDGGESYQPGHAFKSYAVTAVPEPATVALMLAGIAGIGLYRRREMTNTTSTTN